MFASNTLEQLESASFPIQYFSRKAGALIFSPLMTMLFGSSTCGTPLSHAHAITAGKSHNALIIVISLEAMSWPTASSGVQHSKHQRRARIIITGSKAHILLNEPIFLDHSFPSPASACLPRYGQRVHRMNYECISCARVVGCGLEPGSVCIPCLAVNTVLFIHFQPGSPLSSCDNPDQCSAIEAI